MSPIAAFVSETRSNCNKPTRTLHILEFKISDRSKLLEPRRLAHFAPVLPSVQNESKQARRQFYEFGSSLIPLARPREIRNGRSLRCKFLLWPSTFPNYTGKTKY